MYPYYKEKDWLYNKYVNESKTMEDIAKDCLCSKSTISIWTKKHGIEPKSYDFYLKNRVIGNSFNSYIKDVLYGEVLGDGCLVSNCDYTAYYQHGSKFLKYIDWLSTKFSQFGIDTIGKLRENTRKDGSKLYSFTTATCVELKKIYDEFYIGGKKHIPANLELSSTILLHWYIGDGCITKHKNRKEKSVIRLSTNAFDYNEIKTISEEISRVLDIQTKVYSGGKNKGFIIHIPGIHVNKFLSYIGECPKAIEDIYGYKWKY